jgi:predicted RNase H-like nuclease (RuvC/YqgF family)
MQSSKRFPKVIVGFDPGTTAGLAVLDLNGEVLLLKSLRHWSRSSIILEVLSTGTPVLIATDRAEAPRAVKELAQSLSLPIFRVEKEEALDVKNSLVSEFSLKTGIKIEDEHQTAALYATLRAFNSFKNEFKNIEASVEKRIEEFKSVLIEEVKSDLIKGIPPERSIRERLSHTIVQTVDTSIVEQLRKQLLEERKKVEMLKLRLDSLMEGVKRTGGKKVVERVEPKTVISFTPAGSRLRSLDGVLKRQEAGLSELIRVDVFEELTCKKAKGEVQSTVVAAKRFKGNPVKIFKALSSRNVSILVMDTDTLYDEVVEEAASHGILLCEISNIPLETLEGKLYVRRSDIKNLVDKRRDVLTSAVLKRLNELASKP